MDKKYQGSGVTTLANKSTIENEIKQKEQLTEELENLKNKKYIYLGDKLYVKWKGYDNSFNSWIDKKRHCIKWVNIFLNHMIILVEMLKLN